METKIRQTQAYLIKAIADIAATMPLARTVQLYQFALFLKTHPLPTEETFEEIVTDEAIWETQFAATDDDKLAALVAAVEAEIGEGKVLPMFDEHGAFIEHP
ncbi:hypothetical protein [Roseiflexus sp. RS-1]|jgi:hypothetical protein|uniref:hypothetical protein n=1 Tax=Roseiflexus sp. (strain RS-1) TaxID=357808 RepID=UPI0000D7FE23|nr:hypothetical protein [Roseiflexus sp. RS-1]ABQ89307.1 hypothetical protein RoseRS_0898 [Roseiflexus sp. RS-1]